MVQKRSSLAVLISVISLFLIAGCGKGGDDTISAASPFLGGSQGLEIKFLQGSPPDEITDANFPFQAIVSIKNVGEHDLTRNQVRVDLSGILASDFGGGVTTNINPADNPTSRKKDSEGNVIEAVETFATIPQTGNLQLQPNAIKGNTKFTLRADACYQYQTDAIGSLCVLSNMIDIADDAICSPKGSRPISSSGSPVKVTSFRQSIVGQNKIQFSFDIVHSGSGNVFEQEAISAGTGCPKDASNKRVKENKVRVTVNTGIPNTLTCVGVGTGAGTVSNNVILSDGKRTITCTQDVPASDFERNVDIKLEFNYHDSVDKEILAKKLGVSGAPSGAPTINYFTANPTSTTSPSQPSLLSWSTTNAQSCVASPTTGLWSGYKTVPSSSEYVYPTATTTYTLTCTSSTGASQSSSTTVYVGGGVGAPTITFTANPTSVTFGQSSILSWSATNANNCIASGGWSGSKVTNSWTNTVLPAATTQYFLQCSGSGGNSDLKFVIVTVTTAALCSTPTAPRDIRSQIAGTTTAYIQTCFLASASGDSFLISTPNAGSTVISLASGTPSGAGFSVYSGASCLGSAIASGSAPSSLISAFQAAAGSIYCVQVTPPANQNIFVTLSLATP